MLMDIESMEIVMFRPVLHANIIFDKKNNNTFCLSLASLSTRLTEPHLFWTKSVVPQHTLIKKTVCQEFLPQEWKLPYIGSEFGPRKKKRMEHPCFGHDLDCIQ